MYLFNKQGAISPTDAKRKMPMLRLAKSKNIQIKPTEAYTFENTDCLSIINTLCQESGLGFKINYQPEDGFMEFEVYKGRDLTNEVFFSESYSNTEYSELYEQSRDMKNTGYLNNNGVVTEVLGTAQGLFRREMVCTGSDQGEVTKALLSRNMLVSAECGILPNTQFAYGVDWNIGDIVAFIDNALGFQVEKPILEVQESYDNIFTIDVVCGDKIPTIFEKLRNNTERK